MTKQITIKDTQFRTVKVDREHIDKEGRRVQIAFSSEEPVERFFGMEILDHKSESVRLGRLANAGPLLMDHDPRDHVGVVESISLGDDLKGRAVVRFGKSVRAQEVFQDVIDGIRSHISVGYQIHDTRLENLEDSERPIVRVTDWEPLEVSMVSVPADTTVGIGRMIESPDPKEQKTKDQKREKEMKKKPSQKRGRRLAALLNDLIDDAETDERPRSEIISDMGSAAGIDEGTVNQILNAEIDCPPLDRLEGFAEALNVSARRIIAAAESDGCEYDDDGRSNCQIKNERKKEMSPEEKKTIETETMTKELARIKNIETLGEKWNRKEMARKAIESGMDLEVFREKLLGDLESKPMSAESVSGDMTGKEKGKYSLLRAINAAASKDWSKAGLEKEVSDALAKEHGKESRGFFAPYGIDWAGGQNKGQRDLTAGVATAGAELVGTDHLGGQFIDALREALVVRGLGARVLTGLQGNVVIPGLNARTQTEWVAENTAPTEGAPTTRSVTLTPKSVTTFVDLSRRLMLQSDPSVEGVIRNDIILQIASAIDAAAINGAGGNAPTGILQTAGIGSVSMGTPNGGAPTWDGIVELEGDVDISNALMGNLWYLTNASAVSKLKRTAKVTSTDSRMIMENNRELNGYEVARTNLVPNNLVEGTSGTTLSAIIFGNFLDLLIGEWGVLDFLVDPYSLSSQGATRLRAFMDADIGLRHVESFSAAQDVITV